MAFSATYGVIQTLPIKMQSVHFLIE